VNWKLDLVIRCYFRLYIDLFFVQIFSYKKKKKKSDLKQIGILRLDGMGDLVLLMDALRGLRDYFEATRFNIVIIVEEWLLDLAEACPFIDQAITINTKKFKKNFIYRIKKLIEIKSFGFEVFINACIQRELAFGDVMTYLSHAKLRYGFTPQFDQYKERFLGDRFYTNLVSDKKGKVHELERYAELVKEVGADSFSIKNPLLKKRISNKKENYFVVSPGASNKLRCWPVENFGLLSSALYQEYRYVPIIIGSNEDQKIAQLLMKLKPDLPWVDQTGKNRVTELIDLLAKSRFNITNDSGPLHLSLALENKTIGIVGGSDFRSYPGYPVHLRNNLLIIHDQQTDCFNCLGNCLFSDKKDEIKPCLTNITFEQAYNKIIEFL
jgi:ADP-heptose:LPS heptosyltransferase